MSDTPRHGSIKPEERPLDAVAEQGLVLINGPTGVAITLTPEAASRSATSIAKAASTAGEQSRPEPEPSS